MHVLRPEFYPKKIIYDTGRLRLKGPVIFYGGWGAGGIRGVRKKMTPIARSLLMGVMEKNDTSWGGGSWRKMMPWGALGVKLVGVLLQNQGS
jgi:hypothetical protein